jgi:16S rRNA (cytidine1402-2'-O)-methyltransferase
MARKKNKNEKEILPPRTKGNGTLYVVATPIGNLEDITLRAIRILKEADLIAAEDTRHTRKLLTHFGIPTPTISYYKEKEQERSAIIIDKLQEGQNVALVSDAGTPGISDPGSILVQNALSEKIRVEPIPGPSSLTAALSVAGIHDNSFVFLGFAPSRKKQRQDLLVSLSQEKKYLVFFEAPHRIEKFLYDSLEILGDRSVFWCRELTKMHEEMTHSSLALLLDSVSERKIKGESVLIISGAENEPEISDKETKKLLMTYKKSGKWSLKDAVQQITKEHNLSRSAVYRLALNVWK